MYTYWTHTYVYYFCIISKHLLKMLYKHMHIHDTDIVSERGFMSEQGDTDIRVDRVLTTVYIDLL